ncbi:single-stranded DNA-binding protein [Mycoplasma putrefaciens]|uniref:single-stranded DNA-binding protein n=1 Tax=Mycoplasma putrefaciens TaxID=2123 RepID=UPI003DA4AF64
MNQVYLIGRLAKDEFYEKEFEKQNDQKGKLLKFTLATIHSKAVKTQFLEITCYDKLAELFKEIIHKGDLVRVLAVLQNNVYKNKKDQTVSKVEIIATSFQILAKNSKQQAENNQHNNSTVDYETEFDEIMQIMSD